MSQLPKGWTSTELRSLLKFKYGKALIKSKRNIAGSINVYGSNGVVGTHDQAVSHGPTIIVGRKGSVGEINLSPSACWPIDTTYYVDEFPCDLPPTYWALYLKSLRLGEKEKSSAIPGISRDDIYQIEVVIPPLLEQRRIVAKLEKVLTRVNAAQERLAAVPRLLKRFRQSVLSAACSGTLTADWRSKAPAKESLVTRMLAIRERRLARARTKEEALKINQQFDESNGEPDTLPDDWLTLNADSVCDFITKGTTPDTKLITPTGEIPFLKVQHIVESKLDFYSLPCFIPRSVHEDFLQRSKVYPGDVLMNIVGPPLNKVAMVPDEFPEWNINQALAIFRPLEGLDAKYLLYVLSNRGTLEQVLRETRGVVGQSNISLDQCRKLAIPIPPIAEQREIVRRVEALFKTADALEARYLKAKAHVDKLTQSILAKAFRGELVPQDPNDEPASALLKGISQNRATQL